MKYNYKILAPVIILSLLLGTLPAQTAMAGGGPMIVDTTVDENDHSCSDGDCSLRDAIELAIGSSLPPQPINFDPSLSGATITLSSTLSINKHVTIDGTGLSANINISGGGAVRIFEISSGTVEMNRLNIINGSAGGGSGVSNGSELTISNSNIYGHADIAIRNSGTLTVLNSTISNNQAVNSGGGIYNSGTATVINSTFFGNSTGSANLGGGIFHTGIGDLTVLNSTFSGNSASKGGGIFTYGTTIVANSTFSANEADYGGGFHNSGTATILNSTFYGNIASTFGNGLYNEDTLHLKNNILYHDHSADPNQDCYNVSGNTISTDINNILHPMGPDHRCGTLGSAADPLLDTLNDNGGFTQTHALLTGSPAIDAGDNTTCADAATVNNQDQRGVTRPFDGDLDGTAICDIGAFEVNTGKLILKSQAKYDGWVKETSETSNIGGYKNSISDSLKAGDDDENKQYRSILSFGTATLPDNAVITKVVLKVKKQDVVGTNPMKTHNGLYVDIKKYKFNTSPKLQFPDFQAKANMYKAGKFPNKLYSGWYRSVLNNAAFTYINKTGRTQFRLRFLLPDNNDHSADYLRFYSGNAVLDNRPQLIVEYYVP